MYAEEGSLVFAYMSMQTLRACSFDCAARTFHGPERHASGIGRWPLQKPRECCVHPPSTQADSGTYSTLVSQTRSHWQYSFVLQHPFALQSSPTGCYLSFQSMGEGGQAFCLRSCSMRCVSWRHSASAAAVSLSPASFSAAASDSACKPVNEPFYIHPGSEKDQKQCTSAAHKRSEFMAHLNQES